MFPSTAGAKVKIVVATNFSKKSEAALDNALILSRGWNAEIFLFHCFEARQTDYRELDRINVENMERMKDLVIKSLERVAQHGYTPSIEQVNRRISHGKVGHEILEIATGVGADFIVMGAPTSDKFKKIFAEVPCSVLMVKEKES